MKLNTQTGEHEKEIMVFPPWQDEPDIIKDWFCLGVSFANIIQMLTGKVFNAKDMNDFFIRTKSYQYLRLGKNCNRGEESFILYDELEKQWGLQIENIKTKDYMEHPNVYHIIRFYYIYKGKKYSHYSNVLREIVIHGKRWYIVFNVYDGQTILLPVEKAALLKKVTS